MNKTYPGKETNQTTSLYQLYSPEVIPSHISCWHDYNSVTFFLGKALIKTGYKTSVTNYVNPSGS